MAANSPSEQMLKKLLIHNRLITESQMNRVIENSVGRSKNTLPDEILARRLVKPELLHKIVDAITKKGDKFPPLMEDVDGTIEKGKKKDGVGAKDEKVAASAKTAPASASGTKVTPVTPAVTSGTKITPVTPATAKTAPAATSGTKITPVIPAAVKTAPASASGTKVTPVTPAAAKTAPASASGTKVTPVTPAAAKTAPAKPATGAPAQQQQAKKSPPSLNHG